MVYPAKAWPPPPPRVTGLEVVRVERGAGGEATFYRAKPPPKPRPGPPFPAPRMVPAEDLEFARLACRIWAAAAIVGWFVCMYLAGVVGGRW